MSSMENTQRRLMWHGMFLFLLGLVTGFAESGFTNVRMGLAAHLEGVLNGIFLVALGSA
jgi:(hydroxyamino)benzene mutase